MPRAIDKHQQARGAGETSLYSPNRNNLDWSSAMGQISQTSKDAGEQLGDFFDNLSSDFADFVDGLKVDTGIDLTGMVALVDSLFHIGDVLTGRSPLPSFNLFGTPPASLFDNIPLGAIAPAARPNLLANPFFTAADSIAGGPDWHWVATPANQLSPQGEGGSATVVADGTDHDLYANAIGVSVGQEIEFVLPVMWSGLVHTGSPIELRCAAFEHGIQVQAVTLQAVGATASGGWLNLTGAYTVPDPATIAGHVVDEVRMVAHVGAGATSGEAWFSGEAKVQKNVGSNVVPQDWVSGLTGALADLWTQAGDIIDGILNGINGAGTWINATLTDLFDEVSSWFDSTETTAAQSSDTAIGQQDTWDRFLRQLFGDPGASGGTPDDVETFLVSQKDDIATAQASAITVANLANAPKNVPFWVSPNPFEDVSFPRALINEVADPPGGTATPLLTVAAGTVAVSTIRTTANRIYNSVGFLTDGATPPATVYAGLYKVDPATGTMTLTYDFGNISTQITTGTPTAGVAYDTRFNTAADIQAGEGDLWALAILPISTSLKIGAIRKTTLSIATYPKFATATLAGQSSLPSTIVNASQADATRRGWACIGQALAEDPSLLTLVETFNSGDTSDWTSASWNAFNHPVVGGSGPSHMGIASGEVYEVSPFSGSVSWLSSRLAKTPLHQDDHAAELTIGGGGWASLAYNNVTNRAYVRCRNNGTAGVVMHVDANGSDTAGRVRIATVTNMNSIGTVRATSSSAVNVALGTKFRIEAITVAGVGEVFTCYRTTGAHPWVAIPGATWTDASAITGVGKNFRSIGFGTGTYRDGVSGTHACRRIDYFAAYDLAA